jgi:uncharacterized protein YjiK
MRLLLGLVFLLLLVWACDPKSKKSDNSEIEKSQDSKNKLQGLNYDLANPIQKYDLPKKLKEISGLSFFSESELYCVNDELGKIYLFNLSKKEITKTIEFGNDGDYEGIEVVGNICYILRSDGKITSLNLDNEKTEKIDCKQNEVFEYEGLGYDPSTNSLLLAAKEMKGEKVVYAFNLNSARLAPLFSIPQNLLEKNSFGKDFKPSGIAVNPISNEIFVLASSGKKLLVLNKNGNKIKQYDLDPEIFTQPEGICFGKNGELFIASEGGSGNGYILQFGAVIL